jgi:formyl-CoA transferase
VTHPVLGTFAAPGSFFTVDSKRAGPAPAPFLGQHNSEILGTELGLSAEKLAALTAEKII